MWTMCANCKCYVSLGRCYCYEWCYRRGWSITVVIIIIVIVIVVIVVVIIITATRCCGRYPDFSFYWHGHLNWSSIFLHLLLKLNVCYISVSLSLSITKYYADNFNVLRGNFITQLSEIPLLNRHVRGGRSNTPKKKKKNQQP